MASLVSGIVILGFGGRLVMYSSRVLHPGAIGRFTENGNEIGMFTVEGTLGLLIFGGITGGLAAAPVWVVMRPWIPRRWAVVGLGAVSMAGSNWWRRTTGTSTSSNRQPQILSCSWL